MDYNIPTDNRSLVEGCLSGDKECLNLFYTRFAPRMLCVIKRYIHDIKDAEDILHDGFIVAFTRLSSLRDFERVDYWLATIMKNLSLQFLHNQDVAEVLHEFPEMADTPELDDIIDLETLETLILKLPTGYQRVFRLAVLENKSHKEISALLGIAPNSSSSQLLHAKRMMRRLILEYRRQAGMLSLVAIATAGFILWQTHDRPTQSAASLNSLTASIDQAPAIDSDLGYDIPGKKREKAAATSHSNNAAHISPQKLEEKSEAILETCITASLEESSYEVSGEKEKEKEESQTPTETVRPFDTEYSHTYAAAYLNPEKRADNPEWHMKAACASGVYNFGNPSTESDFRNTSSIPPSDNGIGNLGEDGNIQSAIDTHRDKGPLSAPRRQQYYRDYNNVAHHNHIPVSASLCIGKTVYNKLYIETGLSYTYLHSSFETEMAKTDCSWHYLGIPLKIALKTISTGRVDQYASFGGQFDIPLHSKATENNASHTSDLWTGPFSSPAVWSLSLGYGVSFRLSDKIELFAEPTLQYHFRHDHKVPNYWTDNRLGISIPIGIRLKL